MIREGSFHIFYNRVQLVEELIFGVPEGCGETKMVDNKEAEKLVLLEI